MKLAYVLMSKNGQRFLKEDGPENKHTTTDVQEAHTWDALHDVVAYKTSLTTSRWIREMLIVVVTIEETRTL